MNATSRLRPYISDGPAAPGRVRDFVAVDDSGDFSYHRSEQDLLAAFEYVGEARSIVDRGGTDYGLALDPNRHLVLGPALGPAEFHWLRQAWQAAQRVHVGEHRLRRFYAGSRDELLRDLFEILVLEHGSDPATGSWAVEIEGVRTRRYNLQEVDRVLSRMGRLARVHVQDPFGRTYRPVRHRKHWYLPVAAGFILYIEIPAHGGVLRAPNSQVGGLKR
jgi:hypothetical protein